MSSETTRLQMSLLQPAQAQKHVTVNEALMRLDGMVNLVLESVSTVTPPAAAIDGQCWGVPAQAQGDWSGHAGKIAVGSNGGWIFVMPVRGMQGFVLDRASRAIHDGDVWVVGALGLGTTGSAMIAGMAEGEVDLASGSTIISDVFIPGGAMVIGAAARVVTPLSGTLSSWRLGTSGATNRFGQGLGKDTGSWARGMLGSPMTYYQPEPLIISAENGEFTGGRIKLAVHWWEMRLPV
ncbi:DUF2793 domain-containing protein [Paracoccus sp. JM45]|uniref:DUF2793 domain-containing protein n=1 Tax=Paracoccus sp. JM45 TaxID=2283626 RepID=UPI000E6C710E|nr:DUF2793 domain-containing protein [Paracoccus sp. JM45]RJE81222.1 DUF2793 domain-containing protein [Paracoccus sp. JM45]